MAINAAREGLGMDMPLHRAQMTGLAGLQKKRVQADMRCTLQWGQSTGEPLWVAAIVASLGIWRSILMHKLSVLVRCIEHYPWPAVEEPITNRRR